MTEAEKTQEPAIDCSILAGKRILVVDDSSTVRRFLVHTLKKQEADVDDARNGGSALDKLALSHSNQQPYDLIILDINMPDIYGDEILRKIRNNEHTENIPVVMLTSESARSTIEQLTLYNINGYLVKPTNKNRILTAAVNALQIEN
jgi:CheY-like chemotaxis protein